MQTKIHYNLICIHRTYQRACILRPMFEWPHHVRLPLDRPATIRSVECTISVTVTVCHIWNWIIWKRIELNLDLALDGAAAPTLSSTYSFSVLTMVCKNSSRTLAFLCLKQCVSLSSRLCGVSTRLSSNLCSNSWAFSRTVSRLSPSRSTTCGKTVGVYAEKSWPSRPISSVNASRARWAICEKIKFQNLPLF